MRQIPISKPSIGDEEWLALKEPLTTGWLTQGPKVKAFEEAFARRHQVNHALAVTSCTTGLHLVLAALGIGPGDEVIVPAFTWIATANVVLYCGATPVFVDIDLKTFNMDLNQVQSKVTSNTKAIIPVHLFGLCVDVSALKAILPDNIFIIEDAACAAGATIKGKSAGNLGDAAVFSFHPRKSITTGEGGMITTNNDALAKRMEIMRNHGADIPEEIRHHGPKPYLLPDFKVLGFNYRMTDIQAALGLVQLQKLDQFIEERNKWAEFYRTALSNYDWIHCQELPIDGQHAWQSFVCLIDERHSPFTRNELMERLQLKGVSTRPGTHNICDLSYYKEVRQTGHFPNASLCAASTIAFPLFNGLDASDYQYVMELVSESCTELV